MILAPDSFAHQVIVEENPHFGFLDGLAGLGINTYLNAERSSQHTRSAFLLSYSMNT